MGCAAGPRPDCAPPIDARHAPLRLRDAADDRRDRLAWRWAGTPAAAIFGDPILSDAYALCVYGPPGSASPLAWALPIAGKVGCGSDGTRTCWQAGRRRVAYRDRAAVHGGVERVVLGVTRGGQPRIALQGSGPRLFAADAWPAALELPLRVQLQASTGACWEAAYSAAGVRMSARGVFSAVAR
jgi:hypothetical protein